MMHRLLAKIRSLTASLGNSSATKQSCFMQNAQAANQAYRQVAQALDANELNDALRYSITAIAVQPGWAPAYQQLGKVLDRLGRTQEAVSCYRGEVPDSVWFEHDADPGANQSASSANTFERTTDLVTKSREIILTQPITLSENKNTSLAREFSIHSIHPAATFVDRVDQGTAWHDAHNTFIFNRNDQIINEHSVGSLNVVRTLRASHPTHSVNGRVINLGARGISNYFHWMTDILPKLELCRLAGIEIRSTDRFLVPFLQRQFQLATLRKFGIDEEQVYQTHKQSSCITADELIVPYLHNKLATRMGPWVPHFLQRSFGAGTNSPIGSGKKLFIARDSAASHGRWIENNTELEALMRRRGFDIVLPEKHSVDEQAALFSNADVVVGPHGAGLTNIVFCQPGTTIIEFYGAHVAPCYWTLSALLDLKYYHHQCQSSDTSNTTDEADRMRLKSIRKNLDFRVELEDAEALLDLASV